MSKLAKPSAQTALIQQIRDALKGLETAKDDPQVSAIARKRINKQISEAAAEAMSLVARLDSIEAPKSVFDPGNPSTVSFFVALALTAQPRIPLAQLKSFYGAGVYAIYYCGNFGAYGPISGTETPIYVGQAAARSSAASTPREQGTLLATRLHEHRKNIEKATSTLSVEDFYYRALVVQPGWETGSETYLIRLFKPVWNKELKLAYGIGKHGDSSETRGNSRSPWDTLHPARAWATTEHRKSVASIKAELAAHFSQHRPYKNFADLLKHFTDALAQ